MRLFVGIDIDEAIRERIVEFVARMKQRAPDVRFVGAETYHVTLKFIGETQKYEDIRDALRDMNVAAFRMSIRGVGFFPNARSPRIFWAGIHAPEQLQRLARQVSDVLVPLGFEAESQPFKPHLTLARSGSGRPIPKSGDRPSSKLQRVAQLVSTIEEPDFGTMTAREYYLYESRLSPRGAQYTKRERYPLA